MSDIQRRLRRLEHVARPPASVATEERHPEAMQAAEAAYIAAGGPDLDRESPEHAEAVRAMELAFCAAIGIEL